MSNSLDYAMNQSCCGGEEKKQAAREQIDATRETSDHKILKIAPQQSAPIHIGEELKSLFGKEEITKALINQLAHRSMAGPMNSRNDDPPRLCTKKHCLFANEPLTIKPVTCVPGVGRRHGTLCEKHGIVMAHQLLSKYMKSVNDHEFEHSLIQDLGFTARSAAMARDGLKEMRRHLI